MTDHVLTQIRELVEPSLHSCGVELFDAQWVGGTGRGTLRLLIDRPGGVSLDDCERVSTAVAAVLDAYDPIERSYLLEVSSPGADRPLRDHEDWRRHVGSRVNVRFRSGEADTVVEGRLLAVLDDRVEVESRDRRGAAVPISVASGDILAGRLAVEI